MKTLGLLVTVLALMPSLALSRAGARSTSPTDPDWGQAQPATGWWPVTFTEGSEQRRLWIHETHIVRDNFQQERMPLYSLECAEGRCLSTLSAHTLSHWFYALRLGGNNEYHINFNGVMGNWAKAELGEDRTDLQADEDGQVTVLNIEDSITVRAEAAAAAEDVVTNADEAAVGDLLSGAEDMLADADGDNSGLDNSGASGVDGTNTGEAASDTLNATEDAPIVDGSAVPAQATDLQTPAPPSPERQPVTHRGLAMPDRIAAGVGLGWLGMILAVAASATPLGVAAAALTLGGAGFGLATFFGSHEA